MQRSSLRWQNITTVSCEYRLSINKFLSSDALLSSYPTYKSFVKSPYRRLQSMNYKNRSQDCFNMSRRMERALKQALPRTCKALDKWQGVLPQTLHRTGLSKVRLCQCGVSHSLPSDHTFMIPFFMRVLDATTGNLPVPATKGTAKEATPTC